jgi:hypothetical protein
MKAPPSQGLLGPYRHRRRLRDLAPLSGLVALFVLILVAAIVLGYLFFASPQ